MLAEFAWVMKQWQRMCDSMQGGIAKCDGCPLFKVLCQYKPNEKVDFVGAEQIIEKWAKDNPAPVYPTWEQAIAEMYLRSGRTKYHNITEWKINEPIPADIAQKLGIEPKEGT